MIKSRYQAYPDSSDLVITDEESEHVDDEVDPDIGQPF